MIKLIGFVLGLVIAAAVMYYMVMLIAIAFAIATPLAWYYMHQWLQNYVYRIDVSWLIFLAGGSVAIIIAILTISFQAIKAASANPVKSLRTE